jgi:tetrapyrrole methylase family protein / MazG family protein
MPVPENLENFETFVSIIARLRAPDGCPWDREQTHTSLRENLLSETYEVLDALDNGGEGKLCEELGDLLLQIVLHAQIARDEGEFGINDVIRGISEKIIRRHPHIFGDEKVSSSREVLQNWEALKKKEREAGASMLESVPKQMPALAYTYDIQKRVARVGFDWKEIEGNIEKVTEEVREIWQAETKEEKEEEYGDLLFTIANIIRRDGIDPETALRQANRKFFKRFKRMEEICHEKGMEFQKLTFEEQNKLWDEVKKEG